MSSLEVVALNMAVPINTTECLYQSLQKLSSSVPLSNCTLNSYHSFSCLSYLILPGIGSPEIYVLHFFMSVDSCVDPPAVQFIFFNSPNSNNTVLLLSFNETSSLQLPGSDISWDITLIHREFSMDVEVRIHVYTCMHVSAYTYVCY